MPTVEEVRDELMPEAAPRFPFRTSVTTQPAPLTASENASNPVKGTVDVLISKGTFGDYKFKALTVGFTAATNWDKDAPNVLTPAWTSVVPTLSLPPGWSQDTSDPVDGKIRIVPKNGVATRTDVVRLRLDGVPISAKVGVTPVTISVEPTSGDAPQQVHELGKFPAGFSVTGFRADDPVVQHGEATTIRWTATEDSDVSYTFFVNSTEVPAPVGTIYPTGPLHGNTVYRDCCIGG
jgi:hypothetical protein